MPHWKRAIVSAAVLLAIGGGLTAAEPEPKKYAVKFKNAPWETVLDWFAQESGLAPTYSVKPTGSITLMTPGDRTLTLGEVVDLINETMMPQKFVLMRR